MIIFLYYRYFLIMYKRVESNYHPFQTSSFISVCLKSVQLNICHKPGIVAISCSQFGHNFPYQIRHQFDWLTLSRMISGINSNRPSLFARSFVVGLLYTLRMFFAQMTYVRWVKRIEKVLYKTIWKGVCVWAYLLLSILACSNMQHAQNISKHAWTCSACDAKSLKQFLWFSDSLSTVVATKDHKNFKQVAPTTNLQYLGMQLGSSNHKILTIPRCSQITPLWLVFPLLVRVEPNLYPLKKKTVLASNLETLEVK